MSGGEIAAEYRGKYREKAGPLLELIRAKYREVSGITDEEPGG